MSNRIIVPEYSIASNDASSLLDFSSIRPSRQPQDTRSTTSTSQNNQTIKLEAFINILKRSGLPGPVILLGDRKFLGGGSQFAVYKQTHAWTDPNDGFRTTVVAVKQPKVPLDSNVRLNHADPRATRHLEHVLLEILSARDSALLGHPNIAHPFAWSFDSLGFHSPFELVMELADCDLGAYLVDEGRDVLLSEKTWMCRDIAAGLDALHECKLIHGDLKSGNTLLCRRENRMVAKLADFGLSIDTMQTDARLGGTLGWQAPEVELGNVLIPEDIPLCDNYSFGLLVWSMLLYAGKCPPRSEKENRKAMACKQIEDSRDAIGLHASSPLPSIIFNLLDETGKRPRELEDLFESMTEGYKKFDGHRHFMKANPNRGIGVAPAPEIWKRPFAWETPLFNSNFVVDLYSQFKKDPLSLSGGMLFAMYQLMTLAPLQITEPQKAALDVLVASALHGCEPAQATAPMAYRLLNLETPKKVTDEMDMWLERAVASGSTLARNHLKTSSEVAVSRALGHFRSTGGYNFIYCTVDMLADPGQTSWNKGFSKIHWLAAYGSPEDLRRYLASEKDCEIDSMTENEETPLYLACARGSWDITSMLLDHGASASIKCTRFGITCLHWLFSFDDEYQMEVARRLIQCKADIDAVASHPVPFLHYPFLLRTGTPLHWAVATFSHETIRVLIQSGASLLLRDGCDPYSHDDRVRVLDRFDSPDLKPFSTPQIPTQGLSPLDLAAIQHDAFTFEVLLSLSKQVDINAADEEGFTALHRLSSEPIGRTRDGNVFNILSFGGRGDNSDEELNRTIGIIKALGGDLERLTTPSDPKSRRHTPLMLAHLIPDPKVIRALLAAGASVSTENNLGEAALHCLPQDPTSSLECAKLLVSYGADVNHRDSRGSAPILRGAQYRLLDVVEFLLSAGADIDERDYVSHMADQGTNFFGFLARSSYERSIYERNGDERIARLLETYVFSSPDEEKKRRVIDVGNLLGETLLHRFAKRNMPRCTEALLLQNAPVNALHEFFIYSPRTRIKSTVWYETPLDSVLAVKAIRERNMSLHREWSVEEYNRIAKVSNDIIQMLSRAGGKTTPKAAWKHN